jgi:hypothetical protein
LVAKTVCHSSFNVSKKTTKKRKFLQTPFFAILLIDENKIQREMMKQIKQSATPRILTSSLIPIK